MIVKCPRCETEAQYEGNPFRPFCSERCKLIDLGKWVEGAYRIPTKSEAEEEDETSPRDKDSTEE